MLIVNYHQGFTREMCYDGKKEGSDYRKVDSGRVESVLPFLVVWGWFYWLYAPGEELDY